MSDSREKLILRGINDDFYNILNDSNYENYIKFDSLKIIFDGIKRLSEDSLLMWQEIDKINQNIINITEQFKEKESDYHILSQIMFDLIDNGLKEKDIIKIGYSEIEKNKYYIMFKICNFKSINYISNLEVELVRKYPNLNIVLEPVSIDEDINEDVKYFYTTDYRR